MTEETWKCSDLLLQKLFHEYTVSFLAYIMWDPVHMYNAVVNEWTGRRTSRSHLMCASRKHRAHSHGAPAADILDTHEYRKCRKIIPHFSISSPLIFDELAREKYVDWFGYSASVSPYILEQFEKEVGYPFRPEYIIDQGYMNNTYQNSVKRI